ncbi:hypothetical protein ACFQRL_07040 [Microbacterium fluvii]|uniref:Uncharacterized protein n=1 Tax=Microbacterium fluvii TaxID=415215 RepID=A0ABW2HBT0_9MICO|nr:hypothetical protein [Microbacterium fluvii]MCU4672342.1 hypothetical protein [Microbacterium fluvii]
MIREPAVGPAPQPGMEEYVRARVRIIALSLVLVVPAVMTTGCFMGPLLDGRSPFDEPSNASRAQIAAALPLVQDALDDVGDVDPAWRAVAESGADNCEGACNLRVEVSIEPVDPSALTEIDRSDLPDNGFPRYEVPRAVLEAALVASVPVAEQQHVDVYVVPGLGVPVGEITPLADLSASVEALFADDDEATAFSVSFGEHSEGWVRAFTRTHTDVLAAMGLG